MWGGGAPRGSWGGIGVGGLSGGGGVHTETLAEQRPVSGNPGRTQLKSMDMTLRALGGPRGLVSKSCSLDPGRHIRGLRTFGQL